MTGGRLFWYLVLVAALVAVGFMTRLVPQWVHRQAEAPSEPVGGVFAFDLMKPYYPEVGGAPPADPLPAPAFELLVLPGTNSAQMMLKTNRPMSDQVVLKIDDYWLNESFSLEYVYPHLAVRWKPGSALASGERRIQVWAKDRGGAWGTAEFVLQNENPDCTEYGRRIIEGTDTLWNLENAESAAREGLRSFQQYLLLSCRYGVLTRLEVHRELQGFAEAVEGAPETFWSAVTGKRLTGTEVKLAGKVFWRNWNRVLAGFRGQETSPVSPFVSSEIADSARVILERLSRIAKPPGSM